MTDELRSSFKQGISERISEELPGMTKAAQELMVEGIMKGIENSEAVKAALDLSGEGMDKEASVWGTVANIGKKVGGSMADKAGTLAMAGVGGLGIHNYLKAKRNAETINQFADYQNALATVAGRNERLANENSERLNDLGSSIFKFAPTVASDPNVLETVLDNAVQYGGLDAQTVRSLQELEERYRNLNEVPVPRTYML